MIDFTQLINLNILNVSNNHINYIEKTITCLKKLSVFHLHNNKYKGTLSIFDELIDLEDISFDTPE